MPDSKTKTYVLDGKTYTVPADTSMEELDQYIRGQSPQPNLRTGEGMEAQAQQQARNYGLTRATAPYEQQQAELQRRKNLAARWESNNPAAVTNASMAYFPAASARMLLGSKVGSTAGGAIGRQISPEGEQYGEVAGGFLGGVAGSASPRVLGNKAAELLRNPATARQSQLGRPGSVRDILPPQLQRWTLPPWMIPKGEVGTPTNPGPFSEVSAKLPPNLRNDPFTASQPVYPGASLPSAEEFRAQPPTAPYSKLSNKLPTTLRGDPFNPTSAQATRQLRSGVLRVPEPNEAAPPINPNYMASVPREKLLGLAQSRTPGAATQLQQLGNKVIYTPPEGYPGPRQEVLQGKPLPFPGPPTYQPSEKAATLAAPRRSLGPEFESQQREEMISRYKNVLRDPRRTPIDEAEANARLRELGAVQ